jgi:large subunit ribosomal protein L40e
MSLNIFIKTLSGKTLSLDLKGNDKISTIKAIIQQREGVPVDTQRILFEGKDLDNDRTIEECGVTKEAVLHLVLKKRESHTAKLSSYEQQELNVAQSASTSQWYNASAGLNDELVEHRDSDSKFDSYSNPAGFDI